MGLSQQSLQAVLDAGGESGAAIAAELIAGGVGAINETNELVKAADNAAATIGQQAAQAWFGAGVDNAKSYLQGVEAAFDEAQKRLKAKGLKLADIKGISAGFSEAITRPQVASVIPMPSRPEGQGTNLGTGNVTINLSSLVPTAQTGEVIINSIRAYNRAAGPANIAVA
jgi:ribosomal protein S11